MNISRKLPVRKLPVLVSTVSITLASSAAFAGTPGIPGGAVPEPTALLVWLGLAAAGGLFYSRRNRDER